MTPEPHGQPIPSAAAAGSASNRWSPATPLGERARAVTLDLVRHLSVTGSAGERSFAPWLAAMLKAMPGLRPEDVSLIPVPGLPAGRQAVMALARGRGSRAVVLCGHFDVVAVEDYTDLAPLAHDPEPLADALIARLSQTGADPQALDDLASGLFLPGRGILDMKSGLAAGIVALEAHCARPEAERTGSLILLACPDEENQSAGMRAAGPALLALLQTERLQGDLMINLDALQDPADGEHGRILGLGCIGKHLLSALVIGQETHACYPERGINASFLAAELTAELEAAPELTETVEGESGAAPTLLISQDGKPAYDVTTPASHWLALNVITLRRGGAEVLAVARELAKSAMARAMERLARRRGVESLPSVPVFAFAEVDAMARTQSGGLYAEASESLLHRLLADGRSVPEIARQLTLTAWTHARLTGPAVVLGFGSLSYPAVPPLGAIGEQPLADLLMRVVQPLAEAEASPIRIRQFLPIISDMSFAGRIDLQDQQDAARNNPLAGTVLGWDAAGAAAMPVVNLGPWGRDYHHHLERVHQPYAFDLLPRLVQAAAEAVLAR